MLKQISLCASFFVTLQAFALQGHWSGEGEIRDSRNVFNGPCAHLEYLGHREGSVYVLDSFKYKCTRVDSDWVGLKFNIDGQNLLDTETGESMGKLTDSEILFTYEGSVRESLHLKLNPDKSVKMEFVTQNVLGKFEISGQLPQDSR